MFLNLLILYNIEYGFILLMRKSGMGTWNILFLLFLSLLFCLCIYAYMHMHTQTELNWSMFTIHSMHMCVCASVMFEMYSAYLECAGGGSGGIGDGGVQ